MISKIGFWFEVLASRFSYQKLPHYWRYHQSPETKQTPKKALIRHSIDVHISLYTFTFKKKRLIGKIFIPQLNINKLYQ
jgi:hypothetical protein